MPNPFNSLELPLQNIAWEDFLPSIIKADTALANFNGILETIRNPIRFLTHLMTQEAVLLSRFEGTQASLIDILEYEPAPKKIQSNDLLKIDFVDKRSVRCFCLLSSVPAVFVFSAVLKFYLGGVR